LGKIDAGKEGLPDIKDVYTIKEGTVLMNAEIAKKYSKGENEGVLQCNTYVEEMIYEMDKEAYGLIFPEGKKTANAHGEAFKTNGNLEKLNIKNDADIRAMQDLADSGALILMSYINTDSKVSGHLALLGRRDSTLFTVPTSFINSNGDTVNPRQNVLGARVSMSELPILLQAGEVAGATTMNMGTNGWRNERPYQDSDKIDYSNRKSYLLGEGYVSYYVLKRGRK
jgi:hypothetical protein